MIAPETIMKAHQYLYYCLGMPVWSDHNYDIFCQEFNLDGKGGSDLESSYTEEEKNVAQQYLNGTLATTIDSILQVEQK